MVLNYIWILFFLIAFVVSIVRLIFFQEYDIFNQIIKSLFDSAATGFDISLGMTGILTLWMGLMRIAEKGGIINLFTKIIGPFFSRLFPEIPKGHPAFGSIMLNYSANMLGLDNAATPMGLKAMEQLQEANPNKETASNAQIMFLVLNTAGMTLIPLTIMVYRAQLGATNPADVFIPCVLSTFISAIVGMVVVSIVQKIDLLNRFILLYLAVVGVLISVLVWYVSGLSQLQMAKFSSLMSNLILFTLIAFFIFVGMIRKINVFDAFIEGAKDGFNVAIKIIPFLIAMLCAIAVFRAAGGMDFIMEALTSFLNWVGVNADFVPALPTALMKPLSGTGSRGLMIDAMTQYGPDSFVGRLVCVIQGATDTTFYIIAVYFGSVGIKNIRYTILCGLIADFSGIIAAIILSYLFFK